MPLSDREKTVALIANGIAVYSLYREEGKISDESNLFDFILKITPQKYHSNLSVELIDEIFAFVSSAHSS
ncbi:MAG: hypothetical protein GWN01_09535 [Nitrosopumilaceae archaeon]|nr:hypothetical protein [Nitrosopumilaceae archaeon]NIU01147.1 hypothetical protein [Nitrosopumilaceae archaeon]NIU87520.1 hypothetical protein [Nitrosopumilaceae archaeon]NIV65983.1 hypothetical protein [Nitrosopumilaceae archaeon]NIX61749.1 hypothetical protein [Nitrosopumilaceae archaeon]